MYSITINMNITRMQTCGWTLKQCKWMKLASRGSMLTHIHTVIQMNSEWGDAVFLTTAQLTALCPCAGTSACHSAFYSLHHHSCKQPTQFWVLRWWRNCPPLPIWPFQSLTERTGGKNTHCILSCQNWKRLECCCERGMYIVLVIRPAGLKWGWHGARHWDVFCHSGFFLCFIWNSIWYISVPNGVCAIDINYLSITVCDTINLLSAGYPNDWN